MEPLLPNQHSMKLTSSKSLLVEDVTKSGLQAIPLPRFITVRTRSKVRRHPTGWKTAMMTREMILTMMVEAVKGIEMRQATMVLVFLSL